MFLFFTSSSQKNLDSVWGVWNNKKAPQSERLKAINEIIWDKYLYNDTDTALYYANIELEIAQEINDSKAIAEAYNIIGVIHWVTSDYEQAISNIYRALQFYKRTNHLEGMSNSYNNLGIIYSEQGLNDSTLHYYQKALKIREKLGKPKKVSASLNNIGSFYYEIGDYSKSIEYFTQSLKIDESLGNDLDVSIVLSNIGSIYFELEEFDEALDYFNRGLEIDKELDIKLGISNDYTNIAGVYQNYEDFDKAIELYHKSIELCLELNNEIALSTNYNNLGNIYMDLKAYEKALENYMKSYVIRKKIGNIAGTSSSLCGIGNVWFAKGDIDKSLKYAEESFQMASEINALEKIKDGADLLFRIYTKTGKYKKAVEMQTLYFEIRDSLLSEKNTTAVVKQEIQYQYEKQKMVDDKETAIQLAVAEEQKQRQKIISYTIGLALFILSLFSYVIFNRMRLARKQKKIIENQKQEVEQQKSLVEYKNKEITDSIAYAKRIQQAIFPSNDFFLRCFPESFIFFKPKDVVSGDFYWLEKEEGLIYFAVADCTGHGVPGALVSVVCHNALNRAVKEFRLTEPSKILDKTKELVVEQFDKSGESVKDGMDIVLCVLNTTSNELQYAGANNPLWIIRKNCDDLEEIKASKQPIGHFPFSTPFTNHSMNLEKGDTLYLFSDGYADQFGGAKGKKFKQKKLKDLLKEINSSSMSEQKKQLKTTFLNWKNNCEQVDDVSGIGIRV